MDFAQASQSDIFAAPPSKPRQRQPLSAHPAFAPVLGVWGAGLGAAIALVLPVPVIEGVAASLPADLAAQTARAVLAGGTALALALVAYGTGRGLGRRRAGATLRRAKSGDVQPIDPASELGSDSFDAPLPAGLFAHEPDWLPEPPAPDALAAEAAAELAALVNPLRAPEVEPEPEPEPEPECRPQVAAMPDDVLPPPCELDLAGFAALPGRNAVWVGEPLHPEEVLAEDLPVGWAEDAAEPEASQAAEPNPDPALVSAIARLRAVPPAELSLCEMVERFAAALQDYQTARAASGDTEEARREREAVLHEALGALGRITGEGLAAPSPASGPALRAQLWAEAHGFSEHRGAA